MHTEHSELKPSASKTVLRIVFVALALMTLTTGGLGCGLGLDILVRPTRQDYP